MIFLSAIALLVSTLAQTAAPLQPPPPVTQPAAATNPASVEKPVAPLSNPGDPKELVEQARKVNGLAGADAQPWHLKATYEIFDDDGKSKTKGTYEEWWVSEKQYRRSYQSPEFSQVEYGTERGIFRSEDPKRSPGLVSFVVDKLANPLPDEDVILKSKLTLTEVKHGESKLRCVSVSPPTNSSLPPIPLRYCFQADKPMLRAIAGTNNSYLTLFNRILIFQGKYVAGDIQRNSGTKTNLTIHVGLIENLGAINQADFVPPSDAVAAVATVAALRRRVSIASGVAGHMLLKPIEPVYPVSAEAMHIEGTVVVMAVIGKDGHITESRAIIGPSQLFDAATEAVRSALYSPYLLDGKPVEVETTINVIFSLGGHFPAP